MVKLIKVGAKWCGPCKVFEPTLEKVEKDFGDKIEVQRLDADTDVDAVTELGVTSIPIVVILKDGEEVDRLYGAITEQVLRTAINNQL